MADRTQNVRSTLSAKKRMGTSQQIPSGTAAHAAAKVRMYGCNLPLQAVRTESLARLGASMYGRLANLGKWTDRLPLIHGWPGSPRLHRPGRP